MVPYSSDTLSSFAGLNLYKALIPVSMYAENLESYSQVIELLWIF